MSDVRATRIAGKQFNRISRGQLRSLGMSDAAIAHRVASGRLEIAAGGVFAFAPLLAHDPWGRWMAATLTHERTLLSHLSASVAWGVLSTEGATISVTRPGSGGLQRYGDIVVHRSITLVGEHAEQRGIPITSMPRTLLDIACLVSRPALARAVRESVRLELVTLYELGGALGRYRGRRGCRRLAATVQRYSGLPLKDARSGAEIRALELLRDAGVKMPRLNVKVAGHEADLSWPMCRLIIEIDGSPFHQDLGEDARKEGAWKAAGWTVRRLPSDDVYERPERLIALTASAPNVTP